MSAIQSMLTIAWFTSIMIGFYHSPTSAQDAIPELVVDGFSNPRGVAVQPNTGTVFVADTGAQRIVRVIDGKIETVIKDFVKSEPGAGAYAGPLSLLFLDQETLVVGGGGLPAGKDQLSVYQVPEAGRPAIVASKRSGPPRRLREQDQVPGEGDFLALARGNKGVFATGRGDESKGWVSLATVTSRNRIGAFARSIETRTATDVMAPGAITISPQGYLAIGQMGKPNADQDSRLVFFSQSGTLLGNYETGLHDITGLAYGPLHERLFAIDFHAASPDKGGLYKLVDMNSDTQCEAVLMTALKKPTALAFNNQSDCFVTLAGTFSQSGQADGQLIIIRKLDVDLNQ